MFEGKNHVFALATAIGSLGGFQPAPEWFTSVSKSSLWQIFMGAILIYQGGGNLDFTYSLCFSILFFILIKLSNYVYFNNAFKVVKATGSNETIVGESSHEEIAPEEAESFLGYYN